MSKQAIFTKKAPAAIGPYNQAILQQNTLFVSGQIPIDPATGELIEGDRVKETRQCLENIKHILAEAGFSIDHIVKSSIFLTSMEDFITVNEVYGSFFEGCTAPARETVAVAALPKGANVEISVIAMR